jgi:hypothetical protein
MRPDAGVLSTVIDPSFGWALLGLHPSYVTRLLDTSPDRLYKANFLERRKAEVQLRRISLPRTLRISLPQVRRTPWIWHHVEVGENLIREEGANLSVGVQDSCPIL